MYDLLYHFNHLVRVAFSIDAQGVFHITPHVGYNVLVTYNFPWTLSSSLVIAVYW